LEEKGRKKGNAGFRRKIVSTKEKVLTRRGKRETTLPSRITDRVAYKTREKKT